MTVVINGTSGVTFPAGGSGNTAGTVVGTTDTQTLTNKTLGAGLVAGASYLTSGTAQASTSGTAIDFTGIPSWVKRITVIFNGCSLSSSAQFLVQIGAGSVTSTGYLSYCSYQGSAFTGGSYSSTSGFIAALAGANNLVYGSMVIHNISGNTWVENYTFALNGAGTPYSTTGGGNVALSGALDRVRITTTSTDTFDAGSINILYE
jgi:hypothetical protein